MSEPRVLQPGEVAKFGGVVKTFPPHECKDYLSEVWHNQPDATYTSCGICNKITAFRYKSFWRRLKSVLVREIV